MAMAIDQEEKREKEMMEKENTKTLICALNFLSRDLPLPSHLLNSVSSIYHNNNHVPTSSPSSLILIVCFTTDSIRFKCLQFRWRFVTRLSWPYLSPYMSMNIMILHLHYSLDVRIF